jgi:uncharacterized membrane protein
LASYGGLKDYIYLIAAVIYVVAMFPLYFVYQSDPSQTFHILPNLALISIGGISLVFLQFIVASWDAKGPEKKETELPT